MANSLSPALLSAQDNASRYPLVEIKAGQFAEDLPLVGQRLDAQTLDQTGAASLLHSSGRLIAAYTQDEFDVLNYPARSVKLVYTDTQRVEFYYADLFVATGSGKFYDLSLTEMADGNLVLAYVLLDSSGKYNLKVAVFSYDGSGVSQYSIKSAQTFALYSPSICRTGSGYLVTYIQDMTISATRGGTYIGTNDSLITIEVTADGTQTTAKFKWKKGEGAWSSEITMTGSSQTITEGTTITFASGTYWAGQKFWYSVTAARFATGTITVEGMPLDGDTVVMGDKTYTWRTILSTPAVANEVKIDTLGREICAENLRCAITEGTFEGTGAGVRYGTGTVASTKASATRVERSLTLTSLTAGTAGNILTLTVDGTRLKKTAFSGGAASVLGTLYWTPGSKLYKMTASAPGGSWSSAVEPAISGILSSRKKLDTYLLRQADGTLWLFFTYMNAGDMDATAVYNLYYSKSSDDGATWSAAVSLTSFTVPSEIARRPAVVQKLATQIVLAYDSVKTSLIMDKSSPYWTDESSQAIRGLHFNPSTRKLYAVYGNNGVGNKGIYGIVRIDVDTWTLDRFWNANTVPAIPMFFRENHVFYCHGDGAVLAMIAQDAQILVLDDSANTLRILSLEDNSTYGLTQNVTNVPWSSQYHTEYLGGIQVDSASNMLYFAFLKTGNSGVAKILTLDYTQANPSCTVATTFTTYVFDSTIPDVLDATADSMVLDKENGYLIYCTKGLISTNRWAGSIRVFLLSGGGLYRHYYYQDSLPNFSYCGAGHPVIVGGKLYAGQWNYTTNYGQGNYWGVLSVDLTSGAVKWYLPSGIIAGGPQDAQFRCLTATPTGTIVASCKAGVALLDTQTETWSLINNTTTPGVFPTGISDFGGAAIAYDAGNELIFLGVRDASSNSFTGVVAFPAAGKIEQTQYVNAFYSGGVWNFGTAAPLVKGNRDYSAALAVDPATNGLYAFWTRWNRSAGEQLYWDKEAGMLDLSAGLVRGQAIEQKRSVDGQPGKLTFSLDKGHLYDPHNQASLLSRYLKKGKKITLRWGEKIDGVDTWQEGTSVYVLTGVKLSYKRGNYPVLSVECEDRRTLWENLGIVASQYYSGITPDAALGNLLQSYAGVEQTELDLTAMGEEDELYYQWLDTTVKAAVESITNRYGYYMDVDLADNTIKARRIAKDNPVDHVYASVTNLLEFSPDDSYSTLTNRVTVTGEGRTPLDVETAEESVGSESGTLGFFQHKQVHRIYYSDDHQKRAVRPRMEITQNVSSIGFKMGGQMKQWISAVDPEWHWVEVTSQGPNLMPVLLGAIALFLLGKSQPPAVGMISEPAETKRGSWMKDAGLYIALQCLAAVGNYAFTIHACPIGQNYQTFEASANDLELQNDLRGTVIETRIDDPLVYDASQAQQVAQRELWILQAQRRRVKFSKTVHLQDDAGDTLQIPHPYTGALLTLFVTNLTRRMTIPSGSGSGEYTDSLEGWVL
ncbi:hypothetical protein [Anaeromusa acidaminophila]|uniref:hypothetical protein n=1 Tax=Anaeromusa acidaminophila TaxID=81464 RepID=UPI00037DC1A4|nr:hypothetical protein [Anaeromusa acidaminophila]